MISSETDQFISMTKLRNAIINNIVYRLLSNDVSQELWLLAFTNHHPILSAPQSVLHKSNVLLSMVIHGNHGNQHSNCYKLLLQT